MADARSRRVDAKPYRHVQGGDIMNRAIGRSLLLCTAICAIPAAVWAQDAGTPPAAKPAPGGAKPQGLGLEEVVVTARANPATKLRSSISVSTLNDQTIRQSAPSSAADILRDVPGIRAEASGGEGNANISVRGLPVASGGGKFVQFQEDGLPVLEFGDIDFATADTFVRFDDNIQRLEVVRGGSASTFASDAPGAIFNFISKTGDKAGGTLATTQGLDFGESRYDFDYGSPLGDGWKFHFGGFYRDGEGPRPAGFQTMNGGQFKANVTKDFDRGFIRFNVKYLNDTSPAYLPIPIVITGSPGSPNVSSLRGFSAQYGTLLSPYFRTDNYFDHDGNPQTANLNQGYNIRSLDLGFEANVDVGYDINFDDKFKVGRNSGAFLGVYPANVEAAASLAQSIGGPGATLRYATGPSAGQGIGNPAGLGLNGQAVEDTIFNTTLNDLGNVFNDLKFSRKFDAGDFGTVNATLGYYHATQNIQEDWDWNTYLEAADGRNASLLNVFNAAGQQVTLGGKTGFNSGFGFCCARYYNLQYNTNAPYISAAWQRGPINLDGSIRYDWASANGSYTGGGAQTLLPTGDATVPYLPGVLVDPATGLPVNYTKHYLSYSFGLNYLIDPSLAAFVRGSQGGRANAERILFGAGVQPDGSVPQDVAINMVQQVEGGLKWRSQYASIFATGFYAHTEETNFDITQRLNPLINRVYDAEGLELETNVHYGNFTVAGGATYTHSRIVADAITPADVGQVPQRQADFVYQITPGYYADQYNFGLNIIGTTSSYASTPNLLVMPGYTTVNLFVNYFIRPNLQLSVHGNNIFNVIGITEIDANPNAQGVALARTIDGRTFTASLRYTF
jgi:outer membrane receptor protein involved in Fe transport